MSCARRRLHSIMPYSVEFPHGRPRANSVKCQIDIGFGYGRRSFRRGIVEICLVDREKAPPLRGSSNTG